MKKILILFVCLIMDAACSAPPAVHSKTVPPPPPTRSQETPERKNVEKAKELFEYARKENVRLDWDRCLARKAALRARQMVQEGYFSHEDPQTGRNPAWRLVAGCLSCRYAGENLSKGDLPADLIHEAFMESPKHRKNIKDIRFSFMGAGCYRNVCVELFAGY